jgi:hypothetical protein
MNDHLKALAELSERGEERGADRVLAEARTSRATGRPRSRRGPAKVAAAAAIAVVVLAVGLGLHHGADSTSVTSGAGAGATHNYVVPGALPFKPTEVFFDKTQARGVTPGRRALWRLLAVPPTEQK